MYERMINIRNIYKNVHKLYDMIYTNFFTNFRYYKKPFDS